MDIMNSMNLWKDRLGIAGWAYGGRYGFERYAFILHRITGLGLLLYLVMHIFVTAPRLWGREPWDLIMNFVDKPFFKLGEYAVFVGFAFHALNGLRLIFSELGLFMGTPKRPVYPYQTCLMRQRPVFYVVMALSFVIIIFGGMNLFVIIK